MLRSLLLRVHAGVSPGTLSLPRRWSEDKEMLAHKLASMEKGGPGELPRMFIRADQARGSSNARETLATSLCKHKNRLLCSLPANVATAGSVGCPGWGTQVAEAVEVPEG